MTDVILGYDLEKLPRNKSMFLSLTMMFRECQSCEVTDPRKAEESHFCEECLETWDWFTARHELPEESFP